MEIHGAVLSDVLRDSPWRADPKPLGGKSGQGQIVKSGLAVALVVWNGNGCAADGNISGIVGCLIGDGVNSASAGSAAFSPQVDRAVICVLSPG